jgi:dolichol-phosphate mannosyltransferase
MIATLSPTQPIAEQQLNESTTSTFSPSALASDAPDISVIVPAWNEAENIPVLVPRIAEALGAFNFEILIVDDGSKDGTTEVCAQLSRNFPLRLLVRNPPLHGLSGAVLDGIAASRGKTIIVMDADLQHPPERLTALLQALDDGADFALGSRYVPGGSTDGQWTLFRKINSWVATALARPFAGKVRDPMSGFFALRRSTFDRAQRLTPLGYKIALELMCKCRVNRVQEVPIHFGLRTRGESKLNLKQQFRYLEHLSRLYDFTFPHASPILKFLITVFAGYGMGICIFLALNEPGRRRTVSILIAYLAGIMVTAVFHLRYVRTQRDFLLTRNPWRDFFLIASAECIAVAGIAHWMNHHSLAITSLDVFTISFFGGILVRYMLRKELLHDIRGLRREIRVEELAKAQ